ncbi:uncharacterized protein SCHCODRAFT_02124796 [Schizophyllum commune H4-8]|uniref:uncharacterized protein n=1 Tax=Schizophyllum commune (strain H4-8 / FGSC 9210) TaxID=578458 RepID=UPI00215EF812|nr:uncharacterized protein SCHCODRAFT_02124796 [Schizophyllum commune H4-8]KAI5885299.1 hypothetical protein SCHCODRAFT_02124796 [Schizophyllum commune H4-8]
MHLRPASEGYISLRRPRIRHAVPAPLGDEYMYRRPPSEVLYCRATLPALLATPSFRISTDFNTSRALGADAHVSGSTFAPARRRRRRTRARGYRTLRYRLQSPSHLFRRSAAAWASSVMACLLMFGPRLRGQGRASPS